MLFALRLANTPPSYVDVKRHPPVSSADWLAAPTAVAGSCGCNLTARLHEDSVMRTTVFILSTRVSVTRTPVFPARVYTVVFLKRLDKNCSPIPVTTFSLCYLLLFLILVFLFSLQYPLCLIATINHTHYKAY